MIDYRERGFHARGYLAHGSNKGVARGRSRHENTKKRVVRNMEERKVGTKEEKPQTRPTIVKDLTIELSEERYSPYHRLG